MKIAPGYRQTEVGMIPDDWEVVRLHGLADRIMVGIASAATHAYRDRGVVMFRNQNIKPGYLDDTDVLYIDEVYEEAYRNKRLKAGDLLTARTGYPGTTSMVPPQYEGAQSFTTLITRPRRDLVDSEYLCCFINSEAGQSYFEQNQIGGGQKNVNAGSLKRLAVPLPPTRAEQEAIAEALSDADALIESLGQLLAKKRQIKQGAMQELLTGKKRLPGFETEPGTKQTEVGMIPEDWEVKPLGSIATIATGNTPPTRDPANYGDEFLFVSPIDMGAAKYISRTERMLSERGFSISRHFPRGSILFVCIGSTIGKCGIAAQTLTSNQQINAVLPPENMVLDYLFYAVSAVASKVRSLAGEQAVPIVNKAAFSDTAICLPPTKAEQEAISEVLSDMDEEIADLDAKLAKARQLKQGMMQELLTGRIRLV